MTMLQVTNLKSDGYVDDIDQLKQIQIQGGVDTPVFDAARASDTPINISFIQGDGVFFFNITNTDDVTQANFFDGVQVQ